MSPIVASLLALCLTPTVLGGYLSTMVETDLVAGDCTTDGSGMALNHWIEGVAYSTTKSAETGGYLAVEYHGDSAMCCVLPELDLQNGHPCTTPPPPPPQCPQYWEQNNGKCFFFHHKKVDWAAAKASCESLDSTLARPDALTNEFIAQTIANTAADFWFDLNKNNSTEFSWTNSLVPTFTDWAAGEPNNYDFFGGEENCAQYGWLKDFKWNDEGCHNTARYICQRDLE